jgi:sugar lactone lactonase YvrE
LIRYTPKTGESAVLLKDLYFANGVALSQREDFVLVNETYRYRITRYWLRGPKAGTYDVFIDNLPGFPDNLSSNRRGVFWVALFTARSSLADFAHQNPWTKSFMARLPRALWIRPRRYGLVLKIDEKGKIIKSFHDPDGTHLWEITSAKEYHGYLYMGSLHTDRIGKIRLE